MRSETFGCATRHHPFTMPCSLSPIPCFAFKVTSILTSPPTYTLRTCLFPAHLLPFYSSLFFFPRRHRPCHHPLPVRPRHDRQGGGQHAEQEVRVPGAVGWVLWPFCACILKGNLAFSCVYFEGGMWPFVPSGTGLHPGIRPQQLDLGVCPHEAQPPILWCKTCG